MSGKIVPPSHLGFRVLIMVWCQQAGSRATAIKPVCALHFSLVLSFVHPKERTEAKKCDKLVFTNRILGNLKTSLGEND